MGKTLNLIPSTEKHRGEEEVEKRRTSQTWGGGEGERERGRRGRERASRLKHSALGLGGLDFRKSQYHCGPAHLPRHCPWPICICFREGQPSVCGSASPPLPVCTPLILHSRK